MPDTPALLPVPCNGNAIMIAAWKCKSDGSGWEEVYVPAADVGSLSLTSLPSAGVPCGGGQCAKSKLLELAKDGKWSAEDTIKGLKALGS